MKQNSSHELSLRLRQAITAVVSTGIVFASAAYANVPKDVIVVPPSGLPELARQSGEAMLLSDTNDGRAMLYIEQEHGARLAVFDVTDPAHVKGEGSVELGGARPFDFVSPVGSKLELIEYRDTHQEGLMDFRKSKLPKLETVQGLTMQGPVTGLGNDGFIVAGDGPRAPSSQDYQVVDTANSETSSNVVDVKQVRENISKLDTGTTFLLAKDGLYVVRRPKAESEKRRRDEEWFLEHTGN